MQTTNRILLTIALVAMHNESAYPAEWKIDPTLSFKAGYNDNLRLSTDNEISSSEVTFSPSAIFSVETARSGVSGTAGFNFRRFEKDRDLDDNNSRFQINSFYNLERSRLELDLGFVKDTTLDSELEETGLVFDRTRRQSITAKPTWTYTFNQRTRASFNYSYSDVEYKTSDDARFVNYTINSAQTSLTRVMSEQTTATITLSRSLSDTESGVKSTNTNLQGGASYQLSETLSASLFVGARLTKTEFSPGDVIILSGNTIIGTIPLTEKVSNNSSGSTFNASITKTFLRGEMGLSTSRDVSSSSNGQPIEVTRLSSTNLYRFSNIFSISLNLDFYGSKSENDIATRLNREYYQISPKFSWVIKKFWSLSGSYRYRKQTFDDISDESVQNAAYLTLTYRWPRIAVSR